LKIERHNTRTIFLDSIFKLNIFLIEFHNFFHLFFINIFRIYDMDYRFDRLIKVDTIQILNHVIKYFFIIIFPSQVDTHIDLK
jgi:hypothetical protein